MELRNTIDLMNSADYKERFKAEYWQTKIRYDKLHKMITKYEAGTLNFTPVCSLELLKEQKSAMGKYLYCLEVRAEIEGVDILTEPVISDSEDMESLKCNSDSLKVEIMEDKSPLKYAVEDFLTDFGIPSNILGYKFLTDAICSVMENPNITTNVCKELYPQIAKVYSATPSSVERAIRHAIESSYPRASDGVIYEIFKNSLPQGKKPTNTEFIFRVAQLIQRNREKHYNAL